MSKPSTVGYCKPPTRTQFKKGQSGNPGGRPKKDQSFAKAFLEMFDTEVTITENGAKVRVTRREVLLKQLFAKVIAADWRAQIEAYKLLLAIEPPGKAEPNQDLSPEDQQIVDEFERARSAKLKIGKGGCNE